MTRSEELDRMTEADKQADILKSVAQHGCIRFYGKQSVAFWAAAIDALDDAGKIDVQFKEDYDGQCSWIEVRAK